MAQLFCQSCGEQVAFDEPIPRDAECGSCKRDLRSCRNCRHYDPAYNNACRETQADPVEDKQRRNFCEFFYFSRAAFTVTGGAGARASEARAKLDKLFGGSTKPPEPPKSAREKLDALFGGSETTSDRAADARKKLDGLFKKDGEGG